jgi:hypothetical protein
VGKFVVFGSTVTGDGRKAVTVKFFYCTLPGGINSALSIFYVLFTCRDKEEKKKAILEQHVNMTQKQEEMRVIDGKKVP